MPLIDDAVAPSLQLFSIREELDADFVGALTRVREAGFTEVEPYGLAEGIDDWISGLERAGLSAPTAHTSILGEDLDAVFGAASRIGATTLIDPHVDGSRWRTREGIVGIAHDLSAAAERAAEHGIRIGYHNHADEIRLRIDGVSALEVLAAHLSEAVVLQIDAYWVAVAGESPAALIRRLGERVTSLHLKDGPGTGRDNEQVALGAGRQPLTEILEAAPGARRIIELDTVAGDVFADIARSREWLLEQR